MTATSTTSSNYSVRKTLIVEASAERAFRVFTESQGNWWPLATHHIGKHPARSVVIEPREGGRWYEEGEEGAR